MIILGLNAYHGDSSACLVVEGQLVAAAEEERFRRIKHWAGLPTEAVRYCLLSSGITLRDIDHIAINRDPTANTMRKAFFAVSRHPSLALIQDRLSNARKISDIKLLLGSALSVRSAEIKAAVHHIEHHRSHLGSSFFVSAFDSAAVVSVDGFGDFVSSMWGTGHGNRIEISDKVYYPHSLGMFYLALTQYLGFPCYGDEYKVMGLAPYGKPLEIDKMRRIVKLKQKGHFRLDLDFFLHHSRDIAMAWKNTSPTIGRVYSDKLIDLLGPPRAEGEPLNEYHKNLAASLQEMYEDAFFHLLDHVHRITGLRKLCLAGGCAMNSVANGKIFERTGFSDVYIQSAAGDGGGAIGAAFYVWNQVLGNQRSFVMDHAYLGPEFSSEDIERLLKAKAEDLRSQQCSVSLLEDEAALCRRAAEQISQGKVIGWFQGRMEWGPRALGNRSIIGDPRREDMKDILNLKIKRRESFRPFAPSIIREAVNEWFETDHDVPFMLQVYMIRVKKRSLIPAVCHVNGSGRLQTVTADQNPRYYRLIKSFENITGIPVVLNTSFNENEPVVCTPQDALDCFLRTKMDTLVLNDYIIERKLNS